MAKPVEDCTDKELRGLGEWVLNYWNSFDKDEPMSGGDFIEELSWQIERGMLWKNGQESAKGQENFLTEAIESREPSGEVFFEEGEYDHDNGRYENEGEVPTYRIGGHRIAVIE